MDMEISKLRKTLFNFAKSTNACEDALNDIIAIDSLADFKNFLHEYNQEIDTRLKMRQHNIVHHLSPEMIMQYLESPFVADYDKNRVKEFVNKG